MVDESKQAEPEIPADLGGFFPVCLTLDSSSRLTLAQWLVRRIGWIQGTESITAWLWMISPGRFRLLQDSEVAEDPQLSEIRELLNEGKVGLKRDLTEAVADEEAAMVARLLRVTIAPNLKVWRLRLPKIFAELAAGGRDVKKVSVMFSLEGYWEIWLTELLCGQPPKQAGS
jgi:hypothetical protein